ncbi:MAG: hypothetical protein RR626_04940 [Anaerovoracaceae bacterium]
MDKRVRKEGETGFRFIFLADSQHRAGKLPTDKLNAIKPNTSMDFCKIKG